LFLAGANDRERDDQPNDKIFLILEANWDLVQVGKENGGPGTSQMKPVLANAKRHYGFHANFSVV
jgi:hypothetical protein